jgi:hypothetical protein
MIHEIVEKIASSIASTKNIVEEKEVRNLSKGSPEKFEYGLH